MSRNQWESEKCVKSLDRFRGKLSTPPPLGCLVHGVFFALLEINEKCQKFFLFFYRKSRSHAALLLLFIIICLRCREKKMTKFSNWTETKFMTQFIQIFWQDSFRFVSGKFLPVWLVHLFVTGLNFFFVDYLDTIYHTWGVINGSFFFRFFQKKIVFQFEINEYGYVIYEWENRMFL